MPNYKKSLGWALIDVVTLGIPLYIRYLFVKPCENSEDISGGFPDYLYLAMAYPSVVTRNQSRGVCLIFNTGECEAHSPG